MARTLSKGKGREKVGDFEGKIWTGLLGKGRKMIIDWVLNMLLMGRKYKDPLNRFRLALIFLVEAILCPTCGQTNLRPEVVEWWLTLKPFSNTHGDDNHFC